MHSPDRLWWWTGQSWVPAISGDGSWWWDGRNWVPSRPPGLRYEPTVHTRRIQLVLLALVLLRTVFGLLAIAVFAGIAEEILASSLSNSLARSANPPTPAQVARIEQVVRTTFRVAVVFGWVIAVAFQGVIFTGIIRLWRWVYWYLLVVLALGAAGLPALLLEVLGVGVYRDLRLPKWYIAGQALFILADLTVFAWMLYLLRKHGIWARRKVWSSPPR